MKTACTLLILVLALGLVSTAQTSRAIELRQGTLGFLDIVLDDAPLEHELQAAIELSKPLLGDKPVAHFWVELYGVCTINGCTGDFSVSGDVPLTLVRANSNQVSINIPDYTDPAWGLTWGGDYVPSGHAIQITMNRTPNWTEQITTKYSWREPQTGDVRHLLSAATNYSAFNFSGNVLGFTIPIKPGVMTAVDAVITVGVFREQNPRR